jgi:hypothetical protein
MTARSVLSMSAKKGQHEVESSQLLTDVVIGSVQADAEQFELFGGTTLGEGVNTGSPLSIGGHTTFSSENCDYSADGTEATCSFDLSGLGSLLDRALHASRSWYAT